MKKLLLLLLWCIVPLLGATPSALVQEYLHLSEQQIKSLTKSYEFGYPADFGYTLAAIEWQESMAGKYRINLQDPSAGAHGICITTYMSRHKNEIQNTAFNRNRVAQMLVDSHELSCREALDELLDWNRVHHGHWSSVVSSYNAGYGWNTPQGQQYLTAIQAKIKVLKAYAKFSD